MANKKQTVLIVEDEVDLREILKLKLKGEGFGVLEAENGKVGLEMALSQHPDMILLDIIMPVMDGTEMLTELRKDSWGSKAGVIVLSNLTEAEKIRESIEKNTYGYLVKSDCEPDDIVALIRKELGAAK